MSSITKEEVTKRKANLKYQRDKDREKVKGIFKFYEVPGGSMSFVYKKYKEDDVESFTMVDGQIYEIPLGVAKHLNKNGWYPKHKHSVDMNGNPIIDVGSKVRRFGFQSLEFITEEDLTEEGKSV